MPKIDNAALRHQISQYDAIILVANNEASDLTAIEKRFPERSLFVFFNNCLPVVKECFSRPSILCHRAVSDQNTVFTSDAKLTKCINRLGKGLIANIGLFSSNEPVADHALERQSDVLDSVIDFDREFSGFYPQGSVPSTGFAFSMWLTHHFSQKTITLVGFTGLSGDNLKISYDHDWIFEQTILLALEDNARLVRMEPMAQAKRSHDIQQVEKYFPELSSADIINASHVVLKTRVINTEQRIAILWRASRWMVSSRNLFKRAMGRKA